MCTNVFHSKIDVNQENKTIKKTYKAFIWLWHCKPCGMFSFLTFFSLKVVNRSYD